MIKQKHPLLCKAPPPPPPWMVFSYIICLLVYIRVSVVLSVWTYRYTYVCTAFVIMSGYVCMLVYGCVHSYVTSCLCVGLSERVCRCMYVGECTVHLPTALAKITPTHTPCKVGRRIQWQGHLMHFLPSPLPPRSGRNTKGGNVIDGCNLEETGCTVECRS